MKNLQNTYADAALADLVRNFAELAEYSGAVARRDGVKASERADNKELLGWKRLALREANTLRKAYDNPYTRKTMVTAITKGISALTTKTGQMETMADYYDPARVAAVRSIANHFVAELRQQFSEDIRELNETYKEQVTKRIEEGQVEINTTKHLQRAYEVLSNLDTLGAIKATWRDVSCAVALATGRRMAEVHLSATFEAVTDDEWRDVSWLGDNKPDAAHFLKFTGQLKGKGREDGALRNKVFYIPTLVPARLVLDGMAFLSDDSSGKSYRLAQDADTREVNRKYNKDMNLRVKDQWNVIGDVDEMTYHKFRAVYFRCVAQFSHVDINQFAQLAMRILCDNDIETVKSYYRYTVAPESKVII
jgi:hypothetical protein